MPTPSSRRAAALLLLVLSVPALAAPKDPLEAVVDVNVKEAPVATFLDTLSAQAKVNFILTDGLDKATFTAFLHRFTVRRALDALCEAEGLSYRRVGRSSTYIVGPKKLVGSRRPVIIGEGMPTARVDVEVKDAPLSTFLDTLSTQAPVSFAMAGGLEGQRVTATLKGVTVRDALELVLELKGLVCVKQPSGAWLVEPAKG
ncbi:MAG: hypothetical protein KGL53_04205 [Elusimicrobia bacterium]|nr:hypothetical protein [Elusimicrobiota bacterium]